MHLFSEVGKAGLLMDVGITTDLYRDRVKTSDLLPKVRQGLCPLLISGVVSSITNQDLVPPWQWQALSPLFSIWGKTAFSHMCHSVFIHSDTNNVFMLHIQPKLLLTTPQLLYTLFSPWCSCTACSYFGHRARDRVATWRAAFHLGIWPEARRQYAQPLEGNSVDNCQVQAEPQAQTPAYLTLYTYPCSWQPGQNEALRSTASTLNCKGSWRLMDSSLPSDTCCMKQTAVDRDLIFQSLSHCSAHVGHQFT